ncbi:MAG: M28 family peptidase [Bacteroidia bacterium]|nr:M28 family peptidase [Bacteroidia bacterium]
MHKFSHFIFCGIFYLTAQYSPEIHLKNIRKLTSGGDNAEAYFNPAGDKLCLQITNPDKNVPCDQIFYFSISDTVGGKIPQLNRISNGKGRTTCPYFMPDGKHILYASTHENNPSCPEFKKPEGKYVWPVFKEYDIYIARLDGKIKKKLTHHPGYDAEATISPKGDKIVFTSDRSGDLELWVMDIDGKNAKQITHELGYDGGAFFSPDGKKIVFRASRPKTEEQIREYKELLKQGLVAPNNMEIFMCDADGKNLKQITQLGKANWAPFFHPSGKKIIFSSNHHSSRGFDFQLYMIDTTGENLRQITFENHFNAFPMFSPDGKYLVFSSNRLGENPKETNVFIAEWVENPSPDSIRTFELRKHIEYLASDDLKGRGTGTEEEKKAAEYIASYFKKYGLKPLFDSSEKKQSYFYSFKFRKKNKPHDSATAGLPEVKSHNVVGFLDKGAAKTIIIGAHYDHLGLGYDHNSLDPRPEGKIHNGADDNASGTAGILELSRYFALHPTFNQYNMLFMAFSGEELGLIGSKKWTENPNFPLNSVVCMINLDMVGRLNDSTRSLMVYGVGTSPVWVPLLEQCNEKFMFKLVKDSSGIGPSDQTSFYLKNIPVLHFFSGQHKDYHKPSDDADKINYFGEKKILEYIIHIIENMPKEHELKFTPTRNPDKGSIKFKVTMGIMPDYTYEGKGMKIDGVTEGKPAHKAGIQAGDVLVELNGKKINNVQDYMKILSELEIGKKYQGKLLRKNKILTFDVVF